MNDCRNVRVYWGVLQRSPDKKWSARCEMPGVLACTSHWEKGSRDSLKMSFTIILSPGCMTNWRDQKWLKKKTKIFRNLIWEYFIRYFFFDVELLSPVSCWTVNKRRQSPSVWRGGARPMTGGINSWLNALSLNRSLDVSIVTQENLLLCCEANVNRKVFLMRRSSASCLVCTYLCTIL